MARTTYKGDAREGALSRWLIGYQIDGNEAGGVNVEMAPRDEMIERSPLPYPLFKSGRSTDGAIAGGLRSAAADTAATPSVAIYLDANHAWEVRSFSSTTSCFDHVRYPLRDVVEATH